MSELTDFEKEAKADIREAQKATAAEKANKPWSNAFRLLPGSSSHLHWVL